MHCACNGNFRAEERGSEVNETSRVFDRNWLPSDGQTPSHADNQLHHAFISSRPQRLWRCKVLFERHLVSIRIRSCRAAPQGAKQICVREKAPVRRGPCRIELCGNPIRRACVIEWTARSLCENGKSATTGAGALLDSQKASWDIVLCFPLVSKDKPFMCFKGKHWEKINCFGEG